MLLTTKSSFQQCYTFTTPTITVTDQSVSLKSMCWSPNANVTLVGDRAFLEVIKAQWGQKHHERGSSQKSTLGHFCKSSREALRKTWFCCHLYLRSSVPRTIFQCSFYVKLKGIIFSFIFASSVMEGPETPDPHGTLSLLNNHGSLSTSSLYIL